MATLPLGDAELDRHARAVLDAMPLQIAVLDGLGVIRAVNDRWRKNSEANHSVAETGVGVNYLEVCDAAAGRGEEDGAQAATGIRQVLAKAQTNFELEYACLGGSPRRWFKMLCAPMAETGDVLVMHFDITTRRAAEEELRSRERRFRAMIEEGSDIISVHDEHGVMLYQSPSILRVLGYSTTELLGQRVFDFLSEPDLRAVHKFYARMLAKPNMPVRVQTRFRHKDGTWRWFDCTGRNLLQDPAVHGIVISARDVTEYRRAEEARRSSEQELRLFMLATNEITFRCELATGAVTHASGLENVLGYESREIEPRLEWWRARVHPDDLAATSAALLAGLAGEAPAFSVECRFQRAGGTYARVLARSYALRDAAGRATALVGTMSDVSAQRGAEQEIADQARLLDLASDAIIVCDAEHRFLFWNASAESTYGWSAAEVLGRRVDKVLFRDAEEFARILAGLERDGRWSGILNIAVRDGRLLTVEVRCTLERGADGKVQRILSIHTDVTEQKQLEAQLLRTQRLESIGTLAGGIAHDLNNVLGPAMLAIEMLAEAPAGPRRLELVRLLSDSLVRGSRIVRQLLTFARGTDGARAPLEVRTLLQEIEKLVRETFPRQLETRIEAPGDLWLVIGDATQLHQVVLNLVVNARDAIAGAGVITLTAENCCLDEHFAAHEGSARPGPYVLVRVRDTGSGMAPETLHRIFEPFFTTKEQGKGTGLGLSTSHAIVQSHGGFIGVESKPGQGSLFSIYLPADPAAHAETATSPGGWARGHGELILVVDDDDALRSISERVLTEAGYRVITAADGGEGVMAFARAGDEIALVITDLMMPIMSGEQLIAILRRARPSLPIIATTGLGALGHGLLEQGLVQALLQKPHTAHQFLSTVRAALDGVKA